MELFIRFGNPHRQHFRNYVRKGPVDHTHTAHASQMAAMASTSLSARHGYAPTRVTARTGVKAASSASRVPVRVVAGESRIGKAPVLIPQGVTYTLADNLLKVKVRPRMHRSCSPARPDDLGTTSYGASCARPS